MKKEIFIAFNTCDHFYNDLRNAREKFWDIIVKKIAF